MDGPKVNKSDSRVSANALGLIWLSISPRSKR